MERLCALSEAQVRAKVARMSRAVQNAAIDIWSEARQRCELRKYGFVSGFHVSVGLGGQFDLNSSTETQSIGSADLLDPNNLENRKVGLSSSGVVGQIGLGYDWNKPNLFSGFRPPGTRADGFVGVNLDVTFGGGSGSIQGIPGIVPFLTPDVAGSDTLRFRNDVNFDFTGRIGAYVSPTSAIYALGGLSVSSVNLKYGCVGFCAVMPATPAFSADTTMWTYGGVVGAGFETQVDWLSRMAPINSAAPSFYLEYRAHFLQPVTLDVGSLATRFTSQRVDMSYQTAIGGAAFDLAAYRARSDRATVRRWPRFLRDPDHRPALAFAARCDHLNIKEGRMKKLTVLALASLLLAAFSANATEASHRKHTLSGSNLKKVRVIQPVEKPVTRRPIPADTFRA